MLVSELIKCPDCGNTLGIERVVEQVDSAFGLKYDNEHFECKECGSKFFMPEQMEKNRLALQSACGMKMISLVMRYNLDMSEIEDYLSINRLLIKHLNLDKEFHQIDLHLHHNTKDKEDYLKLKKYLEKYQK